MHFSKNILLNLCTLFIACSTLAQQKDTVVKKGNTGLFKHMKVPNPTLPDTDNDGITDQFDKEQNTAKSCPVDTHGVSLDTDKDGVIDCNDKEPLTQRDCFPVDTLGKGKCPGHPCCQEFDEGMVDNFLCTLNNLPSIVFLNNNTNLSELALSTLDSIVDQLSLEPRCEIAIYGYYKENSKYSQKLAKQRIEESVKYLTTKKQIEAGRILFDIYPGIKINTIDFFPISK